MKTDPLAKLKDNYKPVSALGGATITHFYV